MDNTNPVDILIDCFQNHQRSNKREREQADSRVIQQSLTIQMNRRKGNILDKDKDSWGETETVW